MACTILHLSADSVAVSDDSVSVEATSLCDVTGLDTLLHQSRSEKTSERSTPQIQFQSADAQIV